MDIHLQGFNMDEYKDIIGYIRSVEAFRTSRIVLVNFDAPDDNVEEAFRRMLELWPEEEGPPFMATLTREDTIGRSLYGFFGRVVTNSVNLNNGEYCAIYAPSLAWLLEQEGANYWGTRGAFDYNVLVELCLNATRTAKREGYPQYLSNGVLEAEMIMREISQEV